MKPGRPPKDAAKRAKRVNISLPWDVYEMVVQCPAVEVSRICAEALRAECLRLWAAGEQAKLEGGLNN